MSGKAINARLATQLDVILSLKDVNVIALLVKTSFDFNAHGSMFGLDMLTDLCDEQLDSHWGFGTNCKVIHLATDKCVLSIDVARIDVPFMDSVTKPHFVNEGLSDEVFQCHTGFWVTLDGMVERDNIFVSVQPLTKLVETLVVEGVNNFKKTVN